MNRTIDRKLLCPRGRMLASPPVPALAGNQGVDPVHTVRADNGNKRLAGSGDAAARRAARKPWRS